MINYEFSPSRVILVQMFIIRLPSDNTIRPVSAIFLNQKLIYQFMAEVAGPLELVIGTSKR